MGTLCVPHLVLKLDDESARRNGNAEGRVDHQSSVKPDSTLGIVLGNDQCRVYDLGGNKLRSCSSL